MMTTMMTTMMMMEHGTSKAFALVQIINWVKLVAHSCTSLQSPVANETEADVVDESLHTKGRQIDSNCTPWSFPVPPTVQPCSSAMSSITLPACLPSQTPLETPWLSLFLFSVSSLFLSLFFFLKKKKSHDGSPTIHLPCAIFVLFLIYFGCQKALMKIFSLESPSF